MAHRDVSRGGVSIKVGQNFGRRFLGGVEGLLPPMGRPHRLALRVQHSDLPRKNTLLLTVTPF